MHCGVEVTESSTNKQNHLPLLVIVDQFSNSIARSFAAKTVNIFRAIMMMIFIIIMQH